MSAEDIKSLVFRIAKEAAERGPGWAQEGWVLREAGNRLANKNGQRDYHVADELTLEQQRAIVNAWHDLFAEKKLGWGFDIDNPGSPFFHIRDAGQ
jgi:hypothetical protein